MEVADDGKKAEITVPAEDMKALGMEQGKEYSATIRFTLKNENGSPVEIEQVVTLLCPLDETYTSRAEGTDFDGTGDIVLCFEPNGTIPEGYEVRAENYASGSVQINGVPVSEGVVLERTEKGLSMTIPKEVLLSEGYNIAPGENDISVSNVTFFVENTDVDPVKRYTFHINGESFKFNYSLNG